MENVICGSILTALIMFNFIKNLGKRKLIALAIVTILVIALPLILIQVQKQQNLKQRAEGISSAHFIFSPIVQSIKEDQISTILTLSNPNNKNISGVDVTFSYDNSIFEVTGFNSVSFTQIVSEENIPGQFHYVGVSIGQEPIVDNFINLGTLILQVKKKNASTINISNAVVTAVGEEQPLTITPISIPPFISDIDMDPNMGQVGTKFLVFSRVTSKDSLKSVKATVRYQRSIIYEDTIQLYDDGTHGDVKAGDEYYMNVWDSNKKGLPKEIVIEAKDINENVSALSKVFDPTEEVCREAVPGHNDKNANRVNVVFTGANYGNIESFSKDVTEALAFSGTEGGLFSQEPFRSNKDKFNFWYSNRVWNSLRSCDIVNINVFDIIKCRAAIKISASSCVVSNKMIIGLVNLDTHGAFSFGTTIYIPTIGVRSFSLGRSDPLGGVTIHEFGHSFGKLADEYIGSNVLELFPLDRILGEEKTIDSLNIFKGTQEQCFSPKNSWYDLIGRGCGVDNKIDCIKNYDSKNATITCADGVSQTACWTEVGCFPGAGSPDNFRSTYNNIMRGKQLLYTIDLKLFSRSYGPVNEREICKRIKKVTGSAGGICTIDYGIR